MQVILFYALLIGGLALAIGAYIALLGAPVLLVGRRFGVAAGSAFAAVLLGIMYLLYKPPYGGMSLDFAPAGMRPNLFLVGLFQEPPVASLVAGAVMAVIGLSIVVVARLSGHAVRHD